MSRPGKYVSLWLRMGMRLGDMHSSMPPNNAINKRGFSVAHLKFDDFLPMFCREPFFQEATILQESIIYYIF